MTDRQPYTYTILRYRHDPLAGEVVNVGVILHAPKSGFLQCAMRTTYGRLSKLYPDFDGAALTADLKRVRTALARIAASELSDMFSSKKNASHFARQILDDPAGSYIWSEARSGITRHPECELVDIYNRFIGKFESASKVRKSDADIWRPARDKFAEKDLIDLFETKVIRSKRDEIEFEHAWKNGIWHCFQPLSFDLADVDSIKNKAARWVGHVVGLSTADENFRPYFIVGEPSDNGLQDAYERAIAFLSEAPTPNPPQVIREQDVGEFVDHISHKMRQSQQSR